MSVGSTIKQFRLDAGLTIPQVSEGTGLSRGFLSQVENDKASLSLESLQKIAAALGVGAKDCLADDAPAPELVRRGEGARIRAGTGPEVQVLSAPFGRRLQALLVELPAGYQVGGGDHLHEGEEFITVLSGRLRVVQGRFDAVLEEGDSVHLDGSAPHRYLNEGAEPTRCLVALTPPGLLPLVPAPAAPASETSAS